MCVNRTLLNLKTSSDRWLRDGIGGARLPAGDCPYIIRRVLSIFRAPVVPAHNPVTCTFVINFLGFCQTYPQKTELVPKRHVLKPKRCRCFSRKTSKVVVE